MSVPYTRAPHMGGPGTSAVEPSHAALLIDFDNVTMGMRSDLSKELKTLLDTDVIKGKVSVQRAYADWRRYPQYIVPLSEASVDLIFAPAYGSNKKNATDIRMAIDALELVFIRPEIGIYILLTGDSDFSSLVLKLKEYGKYVIGVGIQESSSDILVQNCDEYYSYTSLTGLTKTSELDRSAKDPWQLVRDAVDTMIRRGDVMRSDRLKQVMQELDPTFDEGSIGYSKFSKFLTEASSRGLIGLTKMENGQYEISATKGRGSRREDGRSRSRRGRGGRRDRSERAETAPEDASEATAGEPLTQAYEALRSALSRLREAGRETVRDSDVKRKMLEADRSFDEAELGFAKFSQFLVQAERDSIVTLAPTERGNLDVSLNTAALASSHTAKSSFEGGGGSSVVPGAPEPPASDSPAVAEPEAEDEAPKRGWFGLRWGSRRGASKGDPGVVPTLFEGQGVKASSGTQAKSGETHTEAEAHTVVQVASGDAPEAQRESSATTSDPAPSTGSSDDLSMDAGAAAPVAVPVSDLALPSEAGAIARYLTHRYKGVGEKTAETLVEALGADLFRTMHEDPDAIARIVPKNRAEQVLEAWRSDYERRAAAHSRGRGGSGASSGRGRSRDRS